MRIPFCVIAATIAVLAACGSLTAAPASTDPPTPSVPPFSCADRPNPLPASTPSPVGPRSGIPADAPNGDGFTLFSVVRPGVLTRSGTPTKPQFDYLRGHGWRSIVDLRTTDDTTFAGFTEEGFRYLWLPIDVTQIPTLDQAARFLCFVTQAENQPIDVHDNTGAERTCVMAALFRYSIESWPMETAIHEALLYGGGPNQGQIAFLRRWASNHKPGVLP